MLHSLESLIFQPLCTMLFETIMIRAHSIQQALCPQNYYFHMLFHINKPKVTSTLKISENLVYPKRLPSSKLLPFALLICSFLERVN